MKKPFFAGFAGQNSVSGIIYPQETNAPIAGALSIPIAAGIIIYISTLETITF